MTITVLLRDLAAGVIGIGTASRSLAVGNSVPVLDPRWGAAATQAWTNRELADAALAGLESGYGGMAAIDRAIETDRSRAFRQVAVLPRCGAPGVFTGASCTPWAGHRSADQYVVLGNFLAGAAVLDAAEAALRTEYPKPPAGRQIAHRDTLGSLVYAAIPVAVQRVSRCIADALLAAQDAGGDRRGQQSAALMVAQFGPARRLVETDIDLRVDDCTEPLVELNRLLGLHLGRSVRTGLPGDRKAISPPAG